MNDTTPPEVLALLGAGGFAREIYFHARDAWPDSEVIFVDDVSGVDALQLSGRRVPVVQDWDFSAYQDADLAFLVAVGDPAVKRSLVAKALKAGLTPAPTLVHPSAVVQDVRLGWGGLIAPGCALTTNITLGDYALLGINVSVGHDAEIGNFVTCNPGSIISGNVSLKDGVYLGAGAFVREKLRIAAGVTIGAQACVVKDVTEEGCTVVGVPARTRMEI
jgi:sugar O-acyltransferase (sialic acid O-acetyltransferase NeuD family)